MKKQKQNIWLIFDGKWVGGYWGGLVLEVRMLVNASGMLRMPDAGSADIPKNHKTRKLLFLRENGFRENDVFMVLKRQTAKTKMTAKTTRRYHVFIRISLCDGICQSNPCFSWKPRFSFFCMVNSFHGIHGIHRFHVIHGFHGIHGIHGIHGVWS